MGRTIRRRTGTKASRFQRPRRTRAPIPYQEPTPTPAPPEPWDTEILAKVGPHGLAVALLEAMRLQPTIKSFVLSRLDAEMIIMAMRVPSATLKATEATVIDLMHGARADAR